MRVRELRPRSRSGSTARVQAIIDGEVPDPEGTFVYYWLKNGRAGENFRRKDIVFECFHNFLAFSQWGNTIYQTSWPCWTRTTATRSSGRGTSGR